MSVQLWNFKDGGSQDARFLSENQHAKSSSFKQSCNELWFIKKCQNHTFKINFRYKQARKGFQLLSAMQGIGCFQNLRIF